MRQAQEQVDVSILIDGRAGDLAELRRSLHSAREQTLRRLEVCVLGLQGQGDFGEVSLDRRVRTRLLPAGTTTMDLWRGALHGARGEWVMLMAPGTVLDQHAARNLLLAGLQADADLVCGASERPADGAHGSAASRPAREVTVRHSIEESPELIGEVLPAGRLMRRQWLLDEACTDAPSTAGTEWLLTRAACAAGTIAVIGQVVARSGQVPDDWLESFGQAAHWLRQHRPGALHEAYVNAWVREVVVPGMAGLLAVADELAESRLSAWRAALLAAGAPVGAGLPAPERIALYHLLVADLPGMRRAMRLAEWGAVVEVPIAQRDDRQLWACSHLPDGPAVLDRGVDWWLDVTELAIAGAPLRQARPCHLLEHISEAEPGVLLARGSTRDAFGVLHEGQQAALVLVAEQGRRLGSVPMLLDRQSPADLPEGSVTWAWRAKGPVTGSAGPALPGGARGYLALAVRSGTADHVVPVRMAPDAVPAIEVRVHPGLAIRLEPGARGEVWWVAVPSGSAVRSWRTSLRWWARVARAAHLRLQVVVSWLASRFPPSPTVVFESGRGLAYDGHPRALSEALAGAPVRQAWACAGDPGRFPAHVRVLEAGTLRYRWTVSRARWWVSDGPMRQVIRKHSRNRFLQTWAGIPVARLGQAALEATITPRLERFPPLWQVRRWDLLLAPSRPVGSVLVPAFGFEGDLICPSSPFGDAVRAAAEDLRLRTELDLPTDRAVICWLMSADRLPVDPHALVRELGQEAFMVVARDDGLGIDLPDRCRFAIRDLAGIDDRARYLAAADIVVTDGSSWTLDFARLRRPVLLWEPGYRELCRTTGSFWDLRAVLQGCLIDDPAELLARLSELIAVPRAIPGPVQAAADALADLAGPCSGQGAALALEALLSGRLSRVQDHRRVKAAPW